MKLSEIGARVAAALGKKNEDIILSYRALRRTVGLMGMLLPFACVAGGLCFAGVAVLESISMYYYSNMRDLVCGTLVVVAIFLLCYKGYDLVDRIVTIAAGVFGLGVPAFPCRNRLDPAEFVGIFQLTPDVSDLFHVATSAAFLGILACMSLFLFTKSDPDKRPSPRKKARNVVYVVCGVMMAASLLAIVACHFLMPEELLNELRIVLICETSSLFFFGVSWFVKGETFLRDPKTDRAPQPPAGC